jgi:hypothetical protein
MGSVSEIFQAPTPGTYGVEVIDAQAGVSGKGNSQLILTLAILDGRFAGEQFLDWVGTDPSAKGAGIGRSKLRILLKGTQYDGLADAADSNEVPDQVLAQVLKGRRLFVVIENSPRKLKGEDGKRTDQNMTQLDPATGNLITIMNADVKGYVLHQVGGQVAAQAAQPQQAQALQPQFTAQAQPQFAPQAQSGFVAQQPQQAAAATPNLPFSPNYQPQVANPPWAGQQNGAAPAADAKKPRRGNTTVQDVQG